MKSGLVLPDPGMAYHLSPDGLAKLGPEFNSLVWISMFNQNMDTIKL